jgi:hypothetical protein
MQKPLKRSSCLTFFISVLVLANLVVGCYFLLTLIGVYHQTALPPWMILFSVVVCVGNVACAYGTWRWKHWGVLGFGALALVSYITNIAVTGNFLNLFGLAGSGVLVALVLPHWKQMR